jgi:hypothetical protein
VTEIWGSCAACVLLRREAIDRCGDFDPDFFAELDDVDFAFRARWLGDRFLLVPEAVVLHHRSMTSGRTPEKQLRTARNSLLVGLITHELGHSFLYHHWHWTSSRAFRRAFGEVNKAYRGLDDTWVYFQRRRVAIAPTDHVTAYAARHPQEDFAETFRFYSRDGGGSASCCGVRAQAERVVVYEKFSCCTITCGPQG